MRQKRDLSLRTFSKMLCVMLSLCLLFTGIPSALAEDDQVQLNPLQKVLLRAMELSDDRAQFVKDVLEPLDNTQDVSAITDELVQKVQEYFDTVSEEDITVALETYVGISQARKDALKGAIEDIDLSRELVSLDGFDGIVEKINYQVTGDKNDMRGMVLLVEILNKIQEQLPEDASGALVIDDPDDRGKLKFNIPSALQNVIRSHVNALLPHIETLYNKINDPAYEGKDLFEKLLNYAETTANSFDTEQISSFKIFLQANDGIYEPSIMFDIETSFSIDGKPATELKPEGILNAEIEVYNKSDKAVDALVIVALYKVADGTEIMESTSYLTKNIGPKATESIDGGFRLPENVEGYEVRVFVWEGTSIENTTLIPLSDVIVFPGQ